VSAGSAGSAGSGDVGRAAAHRDGASWWLGAASAVLRRPELWWIALVELRALTGRRWWRAWPPLPLPAKGWMEFRMETAYGDREARPSPRDTVTWLAWCRDLRRQLKQDEATHFL
jgi:hypothetical protein